MHTLKSGTIRVHFNQDWSGRIILFDSSTGSQIFLDAKPFRQLARYVDEYDGDLDPMLDDFFLLVGQKAVVCEAETGHKPEDYCQHLATHEVSWSDRSMRVCDEHLDYAKHVAATDGENDRDDNPIVHPAMSNATVARYWQEFQKSYYVDFAKNVVRRKPKRRLIIEEDFNEVDCGTCNYCNGASDEGFSCDLFSEPLKARDFLEVPFRHRVCLLLDDDEDVRERARSKKP